MSECAVCQAHIVQPGRSICHACIQSNAAKAAEETRNNQIARIKKLAAHELDAARMYERRGSSYFARNALANAKAMEAAAAAMEKSPTVDIPKDDAAK
jgi:hypothetical protein